MALLNAEAVENLLHSSSVSKGIERAMQHIENEMEADQIYIIDYEEHRARLEIAYDLGDGEGFLESKLQTYVESVEDWLHFDKDDLYCVQTGMQFQSEEEEAFYQELEYQAIVEFQLTNHGNIIGYILIGWNEKKRLSEDDLRQLHVLLKLMNDQLIKEFCSEEVGEGDWRLFRLSNSMTKTLIYLVDENYRIQFINEYAKEQYPDIQVGDLSYKAFRGENAVDTDSFLNEIVDGEQLERDLYFTRLEDTFHVVATTVNVQNGKISYLISMQRMEERIRSDRRNAVDRKFIFLLRQIYKDLIGVEIRRDVCYNLLEDDMDRRFSYSMGFVLKWLGKVHRDDKQKFMECFGLDFLQSAYQEGERKKELRFRYLTHSGNYEYMNGIILFDQNTKKDATAYIWFQNVEQERNIQIDEINQLRELLIAARSVADMRGDLLINLSHEIRTPMGGIINMTGVARQVYKEEDKLLECLSNIDEYGSHMMQVMDSTLSALKTEPDNFKIVKQIFKMESLLNRVDIAVRENAEKRNIHFRISTRSQFKELVGDDLRIYQVLRTLLNHFIKDCPIGTDIDLSANQVAVDGKTVYIRFMIEMTGYTFQDGLQESLFDIASETNKPFIQDAYYEISIAASIVRLLDGQIGLDSNEEKSRIYITFPLEIKEKTKISLQKKEVPITNFEGKRILFVEDDERAWDATKAILEVGGFQVDIEKNGEKAVIRFVSQPAYTYDAILMDVHMPVMDGREATRCIRISGKEDAETIPIIGLMANTYEEDIQASLDAGMQAHLAKPVEVDNLYQVLRKVIRSENTKSESE